MKEQAYLKRITDMATRFGWRWWHVPAPMRWTSKGWVPAREAAGLPDLILIHDDPPRMIVAEVKGDGGKLKDEQIVFLKMARGVADHIRDELGEVGIVGGAIGVYFFTPDMEHIVEQMLRTRVLT